MMLTIQHDFTGKKILLAESDESARALLRNMLFRTGAKTETAESREETLQKIAGASPAFYDLVLLDLHLSLAATCETARAIRALPVTGVRELPILAVSDAQSASSTAKARQAGIHDLITQPIKMNVLFSVLHKWLT